LGVAPRAKIFTVRAIEIAACGDVKGSRQRLQQLVAAQ